MADNSITIRELYPHLSDDEVAAAEENLRRYIAVMCRIYERVLAEQGPEAAYRLAYGDLTDSALSSNRLLKNVRGKPLPAVAARQDAVTTKRPL